MADNKILNKVLTALANIKQEAEAEGQLEVNAEATEETKEAVELAEAKIDGVTIEAEEFAVGQAVFAVSEAGERMPLEAGSYKTDEGNMFTVDENGVIASIGEQDMVEEEEEEMSTETEQEAPSPKKVVETESVSRESFFSAIDELKKEIAELKEAHREELSKKDAEIAKAKEQLSAAPSEQATKVAPTPESKPSPFKAKRAEGVGKTVMDRVLARLPQN